MTGRSSAHITHLGKYSTFFAVGCPNYAAIAAQGRPAARKVGDDVRRLTTWVHFQEISY